MKTKDRIRKIVRIVLLTAFSAAVLFPVFYIFSSSLFSRKDFNELNILPSTPVWSNYLSAVKVKNFMRYLVNSVMTSLLEASLRLVITVPAAFAFTHLRFRGKKFLFSLLVITLFIPSDAILYQNYRTVSTLGLLDTWTGIIVTGLFSASQMLLLMGYFKAMGKESYEAARIDGAGDVVYITRILIPISQSVVLTVFIQTLITSFNSYLWPLLVTNRSSGRTIQVALSMLGLAENGEKGALSAVIALITLPGIIILAFTKNRIEETLTRK